MQILNSSQWKQQFETFEKYADCLSNEANDLRTKIEREHREAKRLTSSECKPIVRLLTHAGLVAHEQTKQNIELEERLRITETARAEAMRQLSDMNSS